MSTSQNTPLLAEGDLILRRFSESDIPALFALYADRAVNKFLPWFPIETQAQAESLFREKYETFYRNSAVTVTRSACKRIICPSAMSI